MEVATRKTGPTAGKATEFPSAQASHTATVKDYVLNVDKALTKKLLATKRSPKIEFTYKAGGVIITADAVSFELLKEAAIVYYQASGTRVDRSTGKTGKVVVHYIIKVASEYTLNIYTTTSNLMVNGKNPSLFLETDLEKILEIAKSAQMNGQPLNIVQLNIELSNLLEKSRKLPPEQKKKENSRLKRSNTDSQLVIAKNRRVINSQESEDTENNSSIQCTKCKRNCKSRSLWCTEGLHWIHYRCEGLSNEDIINLESSDSDAYTCSICREPVQRPISVATQMLVIPGIGAPPEVNTLAGDILEEDLESNFNRSDGSLDIENTCGICDLGLSTHYCVCEQCQISCHYNCAYVRDDTAICVSCFGLSEQNLHDAKAKEIKLKKLEDEMKLKERLFKDRAKEHTRVVSHCEKVESRNRELESTLKTLTLRIESIENKNETANLTNLKSSTSIPQAAQVSDNALLLKSVHEKVTNFILKQVDKQLEMLDNNINLQKNSPEIITVTDEEIHITDENKLKHSESPVEGSNSVRNDNSSRSPRNSANAEFVQVPRNKLYESLLGQNLYHTKPSDAKKQQVHLRPQKGSKPSYNENRATEDRTAPQAYSIGTTKEMQQKTGAPGLRNENESSFLGARQPHQNGT